jgi:lysine 2,3-aminomutase
MGSRITALNGSSQARTNAGAAIVQQSADEMDPYPPPSPVTQHDSTDVKQKAKRPARDAAPPNVSSAEIFRRRYFASVAPVEWSDWRWQLRNRLTSSGELERILNLSPNEYDALSGRRGKLPVAITPYYLSLVNPDDASDPIRRSMIPVDAEFNQSAGEAADPLGEEHQSPVHGLVHRYPDRVLFLATNQCAAYCRYCTRSRMVGHREACKQSHPANWENIFKYIRQHTGVRDVLVSGGDPLTMPDEVLEYLLINLRAIKHVEIVRLGTKVPMVLPQRITSQLVKLLKQFHPLWVNIHCTHPSEITPESAKACNRLADAGIPLGSQTVLLAGINDSVETLRTLYHKLLTLRVRPYYLYQCDPILGSGHFRTPVGAGVEIIRNLQGFTTGFAVPKFVIDAPGGGGKIPVNPEYVEGRDGSGAVHLNNFEGKSFEYPDMTAKSLER